MYTEEMFPPVFADPGTEDSFTRDGYVVLPFFDPDEVAKCRKLYFDTMSEPASDFFTTAFLPDGEPRRKVKEGLQEVIAPHVEALMPTYTTCVRHFIVKRGRPDAGPLHLHQDFNFVDHAVHRAVHVWVALADVDEANGCLTMLPGSHKLGHHISAMGLNATPYDPYRQMLEDDCKVGVPMKAGEAVFFDERTLHGSFPNKSPELRIAMGAVFLPKGVKQRLYVADDAKSSQLDILEVASETLLNYSALLRPPYPEGFTKIGTVEYTAQHLTPEVAESLRREPRAVTAVPPSFTPDPAPASIPAAVAEKKGGLSTIMEPSVRNAGLKWQEIDSKGFSVQTFLDPSEVEALHQLYLATIPEVSSPFFLSVFLPAEARRTILDGFHAILDKKLAEFVPGFKMVGASFVMKKANSVGSRMALHQDCSLVDQDKHLGINVWVPLCDVDSSNGCLCVVDYSQRLNRISCLPPLHGAHATFERELPAACITDLPMKAGEACLFDARVLHRSGDNHSDRDRVAAFFNLIPEDQPIRLNLRNPENPERLEVYHTDTDFILELNPIQYPDASQRERLTFVEFIEFSEPKLSMSDFAAVNPNVSWTPPATEAEKVDQVAKVEVVVTLRARLLKLFQRGQR